MVENPPPSAGEVRALANQLLSWAEHLSARAASETLREEERHEVALGLAEAMRDVALLRARFFPGVPFGNLNWEVLLELFIRVARGFRVPLDNFELENGAAADAIRRSIEQLRGEGLVERTADRFDPQVAWLTLSAEGSRRVTAMLMEATRVIQATPADAGASLAELSSINRSA